MTTSNFINGMVNAFLFAIPAWAIIMIIIMAIISCTSFELYDLGPTHPSNLINCYNEFKVNVEPNLCRVVCPGDTTEWEICK